MTINSSIIISRSTEETQQLGKKIGELLTKKTIIALTGELGTGKTAFIQGLAQGLEVEGAYITSPTFTLVNHYIGRLHLFHVDLYRLDDEQSFEDIGIDDILDSDGVIAIEWADKYRPIQLYDRISVNLEFVSDDPEDTTRRITLSELGGGK